MDIEDPADELIACCDVLWEELQWRTQPMGIDNVPPPPEELEAALWQTIELVNMMAGELMMAYSVIEDYREERERATRHTLVEARAQLVGPDGSPL